MSSTYIGFKVYLYDNTNDSLSPQSGLTVKGFNFTTLTDLGTIGTSASDGSISGGTITAASNGDEVRFRVEDDGHGRCGWTYQIAGPSAVSLDLHLRPSRSNNLVFRPEALPPATPTATVDPAWVDVGWRLATEPTASTRLISRMPFSNFISFPNNYSTDQDLQIHVNPVSAFGRPLFSFIGDAPSFPFVQNRENNPPTISQFNTATFSSPDCSVTLAVSGFSLQFARFRYIQSTDDSAVKQIETITVAGSVTSSGTKTLIATATAKGMNASPKAITVNVANGDSSSTVATKVAAALNADADVSRFFTALASTSNVSITANFGTTNDSSMNLALALGTATGITPVTTSTHTTAGAVGTETQEFIDIAHGITGPQWQTEKITATGSTQKRYFRIAHSSASLSGPWSPFSNVIPVTFPDNTGSGGGSGSGDPTPPDKQPEGQIT